ncbi:MAG: N-acetyl-gamma-glutamyl-phosphate reductase [Clostridia bacterium]|nr:N-acetyl-gamma-glutamyl-phosphate reductase [Clostridia bacterium]
MIKASVIGATGYVGAELARLLHGHPGVEIVSLSSKNYAGQKFGELYPGHPCGSFVLDTIDIPNIAQKSDVVFTALPHGASCETVIELDKFDIRIIDMSGDFRYDDINIYEKWYGVEHKSEKLLKEAVYGLSELYREQIAGAKITANPGCYTTCAILSLYPLLENNLIEIGSIVIDAKSGVTGAGRGLSEAVHFCEVDESFKAYKVTGHRHTSEIEQELGKAANEDIIVDFTPHLLPIKRGILETIYAKHKSGVTDEEIASAYAKYSSEPFVTVLEKGKMPEIKSVTGSNSVICGYTINKRTNSLIVVSVIDNLIKGAGGQAVQNMNIMFGLDESAGLCAGAWYL